MSTQRPFDRCTTCGHQRRAHDGGGHCQEPKIDATGEHVGKCPCPMFTEPPHKG